MQDEKLNDVKLKVGLLEKDIQVATNLIERVSESIEKIQEMSLHLVKMITLHEHRHTQHEKIDNELKEDIKELHSRITTQTREMQERIDQVEHHITSRIDALRNELIQHKKQELAEDKHPKKDVTLVGKVESLEKWRWMVAGAVALGAWLIGELDLISKLFK
jgi:C4-dicarboxylate-specific signal transduction histidine kinase